MRSIKILFRNKLLGKHDVITILLCIS